MKRFILLLAIVVLGVALANGQTIIERNTPIKKNKEKEKADEVYKDSGYMSYVEKLSDDDKNSRSSAIKMANSYRMNSKTAQAEYWYAKFIHSNTEAIHFLHYAQVLQSNGKCEEAIKWFKKYKNTGNGDLISRRKFVENCDELSKIKIDQDITLDNMVSINSSHLDFSAIPYENGIVFTSTRGLDGVAKNTDSWTNDNFSDLFIAQENNEGKLSAPQPFLGIINAQFHDGTATFDRNKKVMIFTRNDNRKKKKSDKINLKLYSSTDTDETWSSPKELSFNGDKFNTCHPTMSRDEQHLYFSSNRPGGYGGMDIYVSKRVEGEWSDPINLGAEVNTADNEIFPFVSEDDILYFASNGHKGLGGLDIYKSVKIEDTWVGVENIGKPFNTTSDDFAFITSDNGAMGYLSSNRKGGLGGDDIYKWSRDEALISRGICIVDAATNKPITDAEVTIAETWSEKTMDYKQEDDVLTLKKVEGKENEFVFAVASGVGKDNASQTVLRSDHVGKLNYKFKTETDYSVRIEKDGYLLYEEGLSLEDIRVENEICFELDSKKCKAANIIVLDKLSNAMLPSAMVSIVDAQGMERKYPVDENANLNTCIDYGNELRVKGSHIGYSDASILVPASSKKEGEDIIVYLSQLLYTNAPVVHSSPPAYTKPQTSTPVSELNHYIPALESKINDLHEYFLGSGEKNFSKNQIIELKDVYYDYDESNIRNDASRGLDHVVDLLNLYPSMRISLRSHTDSRGNTYYNKYLSRKRAQNAMAYIISKGIAKDRLIYESFGETQLKNGCADGVECSESEHQENRRTEIRITRFDNANVQVRYE